jgi:carnitine O-acetyltransferase
MFLAADHKHEQLLKKIESSAFVLSLDDLSPVTVDEISHACWVGDGRNRYFITEKYQTRYEYMI